MAVRRTAPLVVWASSGTVAGCAAGQVPPPPVHSSRAIVPSSAGTAAQTSASSPSPPHSTTPAQVLQGQPPAGATASAVIGHTMAACHWQPAGERPFPLAGGPPRRSGRHRLQQRSPRITLGHRRWGCAQPFLRTVAPSGGTAGRGGPAAGGSRRCARAVRGLPPAGGAGSGRRSEAGGGDHQGRRPGGGRHGAGGEGRRGIPVVEARFRTVREGRRRRVGADGPPRVAGHHADVAEEEGGRRASRPMRRAAVQDHAHQDQDEGPGPVPGSTGRPVRSVASETKHAAPPPSPPHNTRRSPGGRRFPDSASCPRRSTRVPPPRRLPAVCRICRGRRLCPPGAPAYASITTAAPRRGRGARVPPG